MSTRIPTMICAGLLATASLASGMTAAAADTKSCDKVSANDRIVALQQINNLMGRYSHLGQLRGENTIGELYALKTPGVSWRSSTGGPEGIEAMSARFLKAGDPIPALPAGQLHTHSMLTPVIEIAGDGKTAKGVWDSFQPGVNNADDVGSMAWIKYGVDFVKEDGVWKIWHLQLFPIFSTPWDKSITQSAKDRREAAAARAGGAGGGAPGAAPGAGAGGERAGGGRVAGAAPGGAVNPPGPATGRAGDPGWSSVKSSWRYDGLTAPRGPKIPEPYCSFDPADSYTAT